MIFPVQASLVLKGLKNLLLILTDKFCFSLDVQVMDLLVKWRSSGDPGLDSQALAILGLSNSIQSEGVSRLHLLSNTEAEIMPVGLFPCYRMKRTLKHFQNSSPATLSNRIYWNKEHAVFYQERKRTCVFKVMKHITMCLMCKIIVFVGRNAI